MTDADVKFMGLALKLARKGIGLVEPNPAVGAVVVKDGQVIGKGWHKQFGGPHAEINAINDCISRGFSTAGATMYVTLEPCCHFGKTPPCADALISNHFVRVVAATTDPSSHNNGKGMEQLLRAGIEVVTVVCEHQARLLNAPFFKFALTGKTWVILKWAQSIDGKLAWSRQDTQHRWISNEQSRKDAHNLRRRAQAILVGINTVLADDPDLTPRPAKGRNPIRVVLDANLRIPLSSALLKTARQTPVIIVTSQNTIEAKSLLAQQVRDSGAEVLAFPDTAGRSNLHFLLQTLAGRGIQQLLVEGGPTVIGSFLKEGLADELCVYIAPILMGVAGKASICDAVARLQDFLVLRHAEVKSFTSDVRLTGLRGEP